MILLDPKTDLKELIFGDGLHAGFAMKALADIPREVPVHFGFRATAGGSSARVIHFDPTSTKEGGMGVIEDLSKAREKRMFSRRERRINRHGRPPMSYTIYIYK